MSLLKGTGLFMFTDMQINKPNWKVNACTVFSRVLASYPEISYIW